MPPSSAEQKTLDIITSVTLKSSSSERNVKLEKATIPVKMCNLYAVRTLCSLRVPAEPFPLQSFGHTGTVLQIFLTFMKGD